MLYAGNNLGRAQSLFEAAIEHRRADQADHQAADARAAELAGTIEAV
jgi:hypothetical protein